MLNILVDPVCNIDEQIAQPSDAGMIALPESGSRWWNNRIMKTT